MRLARLSYSIVLTCGRAVLPTGHASLALPPLAANAENSQ